MEDVRFVVSLTVTVASTKRFYSFDGQRTLNVRCQA